MNYSTNPFGWRFSIGTWFSTQVYVSVFFPLAVLGICLYFGFPMGMVLSALLFVSVLLHEFGHIFGARSTGGIGDEIIIWPLGGLAMVSPGSNTRAKLITTASGPAVNLFLCALLFPFLYRSPLLKNAFIPWQAPISAEAFAAGNMLDNFILLGFHLNFLLLVLNLLPASPLDGGQMLRTVLIDRLGSTRGTTISIIVSFAIALLVGMAAVVGHHSLALSFVLIIVIYCVMDHQRLQMGEHFDDSFLGYDFSQGYTSLEQSDEPRPKRQGFFARWKSKRLAARQEREALAIRQNEQEVDAILAKLHEKGMDALTESEKRQLKQASSRYKEKEGNSG